MIGTNFILRKLFKMLKLQYKDIQVSKSKKTLAFCEQYWKEIKKLKGDETEIIFA